MKIPERRGKFALRRFGFRVHVRDDIMPTFLLRSLYRLTPVLALIILPLGLIAGADDSTPRTPIQIVNTMCAGCHGSTLTGGAGPSLVDSYWNHGNSDESIARSIRDGWPLSRMPPFRRILSGAEIDGLVAYIHQQGEEFAQGRLKIPPPPPDQTITSEKATF